MVRGLASLIAHVYSESSPADIVSFAETLLEEAKLERMVTPTRQHGLAQLRAAIRTFAQHQITGPATLPPAGSP
jgi:sulfur transfer protein SufE